MLKKIEAVFGHRLKLMLSPIWLFPSILIIALVTLTFLRISGSSVGIYSILNGYSKDSSAILGSPRGVRSDEWLVNTQMTVAQANNGFKRINANIGNGQDMSLIYDVPYKDWSAVFKPQNLAFFVMPLENAFAFKWWFLGLILVASCYLLCLELFPTKILRSVLVASLVGLSPMVFWWYQSITILSLAYSFLIILLALRFLKTKSSKTRLGYSVALSYTLVCFGLLLYPPFQIPCLIAVIVFLIAWILDNYPGRAKLRSVLALWPYLIFIITLIVVVGGLFYSTRKDIIRTIEHTAYPGSRIITSGGPTPLLSFSSFLSPNLEYDNKAASGYLGNQSEASNFLFIAPYLIIPSLFLIIRQRREAKKTLWGLLSINVLILFFLIRMYLVTPSWVEPIYRILLLDKVPNTRLLLGLGFAGVLQLILIMKTFDEVSLKKREVRIVATVGALSSLVVMLGVGVYTMHHFPVFIASFSKVLVFSLWIFLGIFLILQKRFAFGISVLILFSVLSVYRVDPLYRGLAPLTKSPITQAIQSYPNTGRWIVLNDRLLINFPIVSDRHSLSSVYFYPQLKLWEQLDKSKEYDFVYNRFAHVVFSDDPGMTAPFTLKYADNFLVKFDPCGQFLQTNAKYVLSPKKISQQCVDFKQSIDLPGRQLYIYEIKPIPAT